MALLTLKDIGKIYVSEGNVTVGIRGVNLSFDRGEFVAITGKSGSGKSTLLNVISGMDSYEEGELYIEGQTTSHYLQPEWEEYRQKYISFIFQDYNIIESFTVLQNVELALMHIEDKKERRRRALELIKRVGLSSHIKHKGSKLSGGQKQRTVIARALAKDSPIILADEPTGNLDSTTSSEIIQLLREVSKDKLLIVVTHNFEQVEAYATRHIRAFDGAVESDHTVRPTETVVNETAAIEKEEKKRSANVKNGLTLGRSIFTAKPKLSVFLCLLMIIGTMGIFLVTTLCGSAADMFDPYYMFEPIEGRLVITKQSGEVITQQELDQLVSDYGAKDSLHYDVLLDEGAVTNMFYRDPASGHYEIVNLNCTYGEHFGEDIVGSYPTADNEVFLYLPISYQTVFGKDTLLTDTVSLNSLELKVSGVAYYYDNNIQGKCLFTQEGFRTATAVHYMLERGGRQITVSVASADGSSSMQWNIREMVPSYAVEEGKLCLDFDEYSKYYGKNYKTTVNFISTYHEYNYHYYDSSKSISFSTIFTDEHISMNIPEITSNFQNFDDKIIIHPTLLREVAEEVLEKSYRQASLFFETNEDAYVAAEKMRNAGYIAIPSDTTYSPDAMTAVMNLVASLMMALVWFLAIVFLSFFINLCSSRALGAFKGDMAIMRSMGIPVKVIRIGMYVRMLLSLIPAFILVAVVAVLIFTTPQLNGFFVYLYGWQYALIFLGMLLLTVRITHKQIRKLFGESVKKSLKGGAAE